jgi:hypothetical protein
LLESAVLVQSFSCNLFFGGTEGFVGTLLVCPKIRREGICSGSSLRFLEEYHLLEKVGPGEEILILAYHSKN